MCFLIKYPVCINCIFSALIQLPKYLLLLFLLFLGVFASAQGEGMQRAKSIRKNPRVQTKLSFSPVLGLYKANPHHAGKARAKMAFCFSVKEEIRIDKKSMSFVGIGIDYMGHGVKFDSYYFPKDSIRLYTGNMNAEYNLNIQELDFPLYIKRSFQRENNALLSGYVFAGYSYRLLIKSVMTVSYYGDEVQYDNGNLQFKIPVFTKSGNSFLQAGAGFQKNNPNKHKAVYGEVQFKYGLSPLYINQPYGPSSLYVRGHFILITVGVKF